MFHIIPMFNFYLYPLFSRHEFKIGLEVIHFSAILSYSITDKTKSFFPGSPVIHQTTVGVAS